MTRRIALVILVTVWATLLAAGVMAYVTTRAVVRADLEGGAWSHLIEPLLDRLFWALVATGIIGAALGAAVVRNLARHALTPLKKAEKAVAVLDDQSLDRRINLSELPPELMPILSKLNDLRSQLEDSSHQRQQFLANASHELRTPVAALLTALEVALRRDRDAHSYRQTLQTCLVDARLLHRLIEGLLVHVRSTAAESGNGSHEPVDLVSLANECVTALQPLAETREIRMSITAPADLQFQSQPDRIRSILLNLLGNAVEYSRDGGTVQLLVEGGQRQGVAFIEVRDTGPGISPRDQPRVFEPFFRIEGSRSSGHLGLGLFLVRAHIEALGGTVQVRSAPDEGTTFRVRIPAHFPSTGDSAPDSIPILIGK